MLKRKSQSKHWTVAWKHKTASHKGCYSHKTIWAVTRKANSWAFVHHITTNGFLKTNSDWCLDQWEAEMRWCRPMGERDELWVLVASPCNTDTSKAHSQSQSFQHIGHNKEVIVPTHSLHQQHLLPLKNNIVWWWWDQEASVFMVSILSLCPAILQADLSPLAACNSQQRWGLMTTSRGPWMPSWSGQDWRGDKLPRRTPRCTTLRSPSVLGLNGSC